MIFIFDQKGNCKATLPSGSLHQGSNLADEIIVLAPIADSAVVTMSARLPNGLYIYPALAENSENPIALEKLETREVLRAPAGTVYSAFHILVPATMTQYAGTLTVQFTFTMGHNPGKDENGEASFSAGQTVTTTALALTVEPGAPILAPKYTADDFGKITAYLNAANESAEEAEKWAKEVKSRTLNLRNGEKFGSLVQVPVEEEKTPQEPTREYQVLLGENPPGDENDIFEIGDRFRVRSDGSVYAPGTPTGDNDLIRRCDAPPLIAPEKKGGATMIYGVYAKSDSKPNGQQAAFPASPSVVQKGWIPFRSEYGDLLVPAAPSADNAAASKAFVNSSISTNTATFRGTWEKQEFLLIPWQDKDPKMDYYVDSNDYAFAEYKDNAGNTVYDRYKWSRRWSFEYSMNTTGFTVAQWEAINSGITNAVIESLRSSINGKRDLIPPPAKGDVGRVYCSIPIDDDHPQGMQGAMPYSPTKIASGVIPVRTANGNILVPLTPTEPMHAASKSYVDSKVAEIGTGGGAKLIKFGGRVMGWGIGWHFKGEVIVPAGETYYYFNVTTHPQDGAYCDVPVEFASLKVTTAPSVRVSSIRLVSQFPVGLWESETAAPQTATIESSKITKHANEYAFEDWFAYLTQSDYGVGYCVIDV